MTELPGHPPNCRIQPPSCQHPSHHPTSQFIPWKLSTLPTMLAQLLLLLAASLVAQLTLAPPCRRPGRTSVAEARRRAPRAPAFRPGLERPKPTRMEELKDVMLVTFGFSSHLCFSMILGDSLSFFVLVFFPFFLSLSLSLCLIYIHHNYCKRSCLWCGFAGAWSPDSMGSSEVKKDSSFDDAAQWINQGGRAIVVDRVARLWDVSQDIAKALETKTCQCQRCRTRERQLMEEFQRSDRVILFHMLPVSSSWGI